MIDPLAQKIAAAHVTLEEVIPKVGDTFGPVWTVVRVGAGSSVWFWGNKAVPSGTIVKMFGGPLFLLDGPQLRPIGEPES